MEEMKAAVEVDAEAQVEVSKECLEGVRGIGIDVSEPGCNEWGVFDGVEDLGEVWVGQFEVFGVCDCSLVGCDYGMVEVVGDAVCVYVVC